MTPEAHVYAIALVTPEGRPSPPALREPWYLPSVPGAGFEARHARKFNTPADAESHLRGDAAVRKMTGEARAQYLATIPDYYAVVGLLPRALEEAERQAARKWGAARS